MIKIENENCSLCQEEIPKKKIFFSCSHSICMKCFPYIWYNILDVQGLNLTFFTMKQQKITCPLCRVGVASLPNNISEFIEYLQHYEFQKDIRLETICAGCNKQISGIKFCMDCNKNFCDSCFNQTHSVTNYKKHVLVNCEIHRCKCGFKKNLNKFCMSCKSAICDTCHTAIHKTHGKIMNLVDIENKLKNNISYDEIKKDFKIFEKDFNQFQSNLYSLLEKEIIDFQKELQKNINDLIDLLISTKDKIISKNLEILDFFKNQVQITNLSISLISQEFDKLQKLHPNKKLFLGNFFNNETKRKFYFADFRLMKIELENQKLMSQIIEDSKKKLQDLLSFNLKSNLMEDKKLIMSTHSYLRTINNTYNNFQIKPTDLKQQTILENGSFYSASFHANQVCSFMIMNETFLAWPTIMPMLHTPNPILLENNTQNFFPIIIYNLSNNQREKILEANNQTEIKCLGTYPKDSVNYCSKRWFYFGDQRGILHFFDISKKESNFIKVGTIITNLQKPILAVCISDNSPSNDDNIFLSSNSPKSSNIFCFISFNEQGSPILIYQYNEIGNIWIKHKELMPQSPELCTMINFYYDEFLKKNFYFFAFAKSCVQMYDFNYNLWNDHLKFPTDEIVTSLNIFSKKPNSSSEIIIEEVEKKDFFVLYTQLNSIVFVGDIQKGTIILKKELPYPKPNIYDLCIWRNLQSYDENDIFIISNSLKNNLKVMYFGNQEISTIKVKGAQKSVINVIKTIKNGMECLICFSYDKAEADKSSIVCIHNE